MYFKDIIEIDDPVDQYAKHTLLHDAVIMNREELFDFLLKMKANLMVKDANGYTALLKAAALGRTQMVKALIEAGVDPRHKDPYGNTPRDKAILYNRYELAQYLEQMEKKYASGEIKSDIDWSDKKNLRRSGRFITRFDY